MIDRHSVLTPSQRNASVSIGGTNNPGKGYDSISKDHFRSCIAHLNSLLLTLPMDRMESAGASTTRWVWYGVRKNR